MQSGSCKPFISFLFFSEWISCNHAMLEEFACTCVCIREYATGPSTDESLNHLLKNIRSKEVRNNIGNQPNFV